MSISVLVFIGQPFAQHTAIMLLIFLNTICSCSVALQNGTKHQFGSLVKLGKGPTDCLKLLHKVYGKAMMSRARLFE